VPTQPAWVVEKVVDWDLRALRSDSSSPLLPGGRASSETQRICPRGRLGPRLSRRLKLATRRPIPSICLLPWLGRSAPARLAAALPGGP